MDAKNVIQHFTSNGVKVSLYRDLKTPYVYASFTYQGKSYRISTHKRYDANDILPAIEGARDLLYQVINGTYRKRAKILTLAELLDSYVDMKEKGALLGKKTIYDYRLTANYIKEWGGGKNCNSFIDALFHDDYIKWIRTYHLRNDKVTYHRINPKTGKPVKVRGKRFKEAGNQTIVKHIGLIVAALRWGQRQKGILRGIPIHQLDKSNIVINPVDDNYFKNDDEYKAFQDALWNPKNKDDEHLADKDPAMLTKSEREFLRKSQTVYWLLVFLVHSGARFDSEIQPDRFKVKDIEYGKIKGAEYILGTLWLRGRKSKKKKNIESPIPITPRMNEALEFFLKRPAAHNGTKPDAPVFVWDNGAPINGSNIRRYWNHAMEQSKIGRRINVYGARKNAISRWIASGYNIVEVQRMSGHTNASVLLSVYAKTSESHIARSAQQHEILRNKDFISENDLAGV